MKKLNTIVWIAVFLCLFSIMILYTSDSGAGEPQDKRMHIGVCECEDGWTGVGWSCSQPGNECYTSSGCFCN